jgi:predicted deacylase
MQGNIVFLPVVNPLSMRQHQQDFPHEMGRYLRSQPPNERFNLNRAWPGDRKGMLHQRLAAAAWSVIRKADAVIDLHGWSDQHIGLAWCRPRDRALMRALGFPWSQVMPKPASTGMLEVACNDSKIPCVTCELTPQDTVFGPSVRYGIQGITNVARHMGILSGDPEYPWARYELRSGGGQALVAEAPGLVVTTHEIGQIVEPGEIVVELVDLQTFKRVQRGGPTRRTVIRRICGEFGTGWVGYHIVEKGQTMAVFSEIDREWPAELKAT